MVHTETPRPQVIRLRISVGKQMFRALTRYPRVSYGEREILKKRLKAPVVWEDPIGDFPSSNYQDYNSSVVVHKITGTKRTRVVFEGDLERHKYFYDVYIDREAIRSQISDLGEKLFIFLSDSFCRG